MPEDHIVTSGDCFSSLSFEHGFFWETLWNHGKNAELKSRRKDPNILKEGDVVHIPDLTLKEEQGATEQRHKFKLKGVPAKLKVRVMRAKVEKEKQSSPSGGNGSAPGGLEAMAGSLTGAGGGGDANSNMADPDYNPPKWEEEPIKNAPYILDVDGVIADQGTTDGDGCVEIPLIPNARVGKLIINQGKPEEKIITLGLGGMDPIDEVTGVRMRLKNLGFFCSVDGPEDDPELKEAVRKFQEKNSMEATGTVDSAFKDKLKQSHGS